VDNVVPEYSNYVRINSKAVNECRKWAFAELNNGNMKKALAVRKVCAKMQSRLEEAATREAIK